MANRSDFARATLPRAIKRQIASTPFANAHERGEVIRLWVEAHAQHKRARNRSLAAKTNVSGGGNDE